MKVTPLLMPARKADHSSTVTPVDVHGRREPAESTSR